MKLFTFTFTLLFLCLSLSAQESKSNIENFGWLSGCWQSKGNNQNVAITEQWTKPVGQSMLGMARTIKNGKMTGFEFLRIVQIDSDIFYISKPSQNKEETAFKLIKSKDNELIFENPEHDFPQRIIYRLEKDNSLFARIEGNSKGTLRGIDFPSIRVKCD